MGKLGALFQSRRFWAAIVAGILNVVGPALGFTEAMTLNITAAIGFWIVGDSITKT
jgi:hypothetical protein